MAVKKKTKDILEDINENNINEAAQDFSRSLGIVLKDARKQMNATFDEISRKLCIQHGYLKAMEEGRLDDLPGEPYRSGFIKSYSSFLKLDSDGLIEEYRQNCFVKGQVYHFPEPIEEVKAPKLSWVVWSVVAIVVLCVSFYFLTREDPNMGNYLTDIPERLLM